MIYLKELIEKIILENDVGTVEPVEPVEPVNKWKFNNEVGKKYLNFIRIKSELNNLSEQMTNILIPKSKQLFKLYNEKSKSSNREDKIIGYQTKKTLVEYEKQIKFLNKLIKYFESVINSYLIENTWEKYLELGKKFISHHNLSDIEPQDILTEETFLLSLIKKMIMMKEKGFDGDLLHKKLSENFPNIKYFIFSDNIIGSKLFENDSLFDNIQVFNKNPELILLMEDDLIEYDSNLINHPVNLTFELLDYLCEEHKIILN
jgi:hypothetical protein